MSNASNIWIEFLPHIFHLSLGLKGLISNLLMIIRGLCKPYVCGDIDVYYTYTVNFGAFYPYILFHCRHAIRTYDGPKLAYI